MKITRRPWQVPLTSHIAYNMSDGKICDTVTSTILRLMPIMVCRMGRGLPVRIAAYADGVAPALGELAPVILAPTRWVSRR